MVPGLVSEKAFGVLHLTVKQRPGETRMTLQIRLTAGWYARYERAGILESTCCVAVSRSTKEEFHEFYKIPDDSDIEVIHNGCDARVFRPPNKDHEKEQLAHERIRKEYGCADEEALNYDQKHRRR
jgi:glycosyltransferase involved in cell wall biosynthesis